MRWHHAEQSISATKVRVQWLCEEAPLTWGDAIMLLKDDLPFRHHLDEIMAHAPFEAMLWESAPMQSTNDPFEFVLIDCPPLAGVTGDPQPFADKLASARDDTSIVTFPNLSGDAILVVPAHRGPIQHYGHLAAFVRHAPSAQRDALWRALGEALCKRTGVHPGPLWISTCGLGVYWLHLRIDTTPKYYTHGPYRVPRGD